MNFEVVIPALKEGKIAYRESWLSWEEKNSFIFMQVSSTIHIEFVARMQSLPMIVKHIFAKRFAERGSDAISYLDQIAKVNDDNTIRGYSPSIEDVLATDWKIIEED